MSTYGLTGHANKEMRDLAHANAKENGFSVSAWIEAIVDFLLSHPTQREQFNKITKLYLLEHPRISPGENMKKWQMMKREEKEAELKKQDQPPIELLIAMMKEFHQTQTTLLQRVEEMQPLRALL